jgi:hypothetical protein
MSPAEVAGTRRRRLYVNWLWINIPLMAVFFLAMTGIPLWLVFRHPDRGPIEAVANSQAHVGAPAVARSQQSQAHPAVVAARQTAARAETAPMVAIRLSVAGGDDELVVPTLSRAQR